MKAGGRLDRSCLIASPTTRSDKTYRRPRHRMPCPACRSPSRHAAINDRTLRDSHRIPLIVSSERQHGIVAVVHSSIIGRLPVPPPSAEEPYVLTAPVPCRPAWSKLPTCTDELTDLTTTTCHACSTDGTHPNPRSSHTRARVLSTQSRSMCEIGS